MLLCRILCAAHIILGIQRHMRTVGTTFCMGYQRKEGRYMASRAYLHLPSGVSRYHPSTVHEITRQIHHVLNDAFVRMFSALPSPPSVQCRIVVLSARDLHCPPRCSIITPPLSSI
ncbi:hypothetical protein EDB19DRAFT_1755028 [Suillus lakei]|nr:hypothetical protein EDB19DRAFT_1755028 [Suillus lakei]